MRFESQYDWGMNAFADFFDLLAAVGLVTLAAVIAVVVRAGVRERRRAAPDADGRLPRL